MQICNKEEKIMDTINEKLELDESDDDDKMIMNMIILLNAKIIL